jgi:hypothetical protein
MTVAKYLRNLSPEQRLEAEKKRAETRMKNIKRRQEADIAGIGGPTIDEHYDPLLEALIKEHKERDPVFTKKEEKD